MNKAIIIRSIEEIKSIVEVAQVQPYLLSLILKHLENILNAMED